MPKHTVNLPSLAPWLVLTISSRSGAFSPSVFSRVRDTNRPKIGVIDPVPNVGDFDFLHPEIRTRRRHAGTSQRLPHGDEMLPGSGNRHRGINGHNNPSSHLSAAALTAEIPFHESVTPSAVGSDFVPRDNVDGVKNLLSAALLITGNTVGPGMICLPEFAAGPGMGVSVALFMGLFGINWLSGLLIAELAIKQHETSNGDVPSSFKDFADATLQSPVAGNAIAAVSVFINWCVLSFSLVRGGDLASAHFPELSLDNTMATVGVAISMTGLVASQTNEALSRFASVAVAVLFASFAGLLLPGLANVHDPIGALFAPGTSGNILDSAMVAAPLFIQSMIYQNIVPSVTKLLDYDRAKSAIAIFLGSFIPTMMYMSFCFAVLGGGLDSSVGSGGPFLTAFSVASLAGSSVACIMSIAEEFDSVLSKLFMPESPSGAKTSVSVQSQSISTPSVLLAVVPPLLAGLLFSGGENFSAALSCSGQLCPLLYGLLPVILAFMQCNGEGKAQESGTASITNQEQGNLVPGGFVSLSLLGVFSFGFVGQELFNDLSLVLSSGVGALA